MPEHLPLQVNIDRALTDFMKETAGRLAIPQRTVMRVREILLLQQRLLKMPGRKPENVITRPAFVETVEYLRFCSGDNPVLGKTVGWWERFAAGKGVTAPLPGSPSENMEERTKGKRRKRRKKKSKSLAE